MLVIQWVYFLVILFAYCLQRAPVVFGCRLSASNYADLPADAHPGILTSWNCHLHLSHVWLLNPWIFWAASEIGITFQGLLSEYPMQACNHRSFFVCVTSLACSLHLLTCHTVMRAYMQTGLYKPLDFEFLNVVFFLPIRRL